jgi:hypothetical protein
MKGWIYLGSLLVLGAMLPAQTVDAGSREVRKVEVFPANGEIRVEVTLTEAVTPSVVVTQHPDRLVLKLPGTVAQAQQKRISVGQLGVRSVRFGLNRPDPPETHLVVDLDQEHPYKILMEGTKIILVVETPLSLAARQRTPPAAAASRPLLRSMGRSTDSGSPQGSQSSQDGALLSPPASGPPIQFPSGTPDSPSTSSTASSGPASAKHPKTGSLQQGTVFPTAGSPGAGVVPPVSDLPRPSGLNDGSAQVSANASVPSGSAEKPLLQEPKPGTAASPEVATSVRQDSIASLPESSEQNVAKAPDQQPAAITSPASVASAESQAAKAAVPPPMAARPPIAPTSSPTIAVSPTPSPVPPDEKAMAKPVETLAPEAAKAPETTPAATAPVAEQKANPAVAQASEPPAEVLPDTAADSNAPAEGAGQGRMLLPARAGGSSDLRTAFRVKYVAQDAAYLDGGRAAGLTEGMKLVVRDLPNAGAVGAEGSDSAAAGDVAELEVLSVAETSSVTEVHTPKRAVKVGDLAYLSSSDQQSLVERNALSATRKYPAVVSFTENDTLDDEARAEVPKPPLPSVNRARGHIGFDYIGVANHDGSGMTSSNLGMVLRADITRINGTYWNVSGYWRGRFNSSTAGPQTLQDLINRTYHLYTSYENPSSAWVAGFGRMYLPWATSLDTIDGGYFGRKVKPGVTTGIFLGSTPDPTSYSYDPHRQIGGAFVNFEGGSYDDLHYTSTSGGGLKLLSWTPNRPFVFFENGIFYKRIFSIYQTAQLDSQPGYDYTAPDGTIAHQAATQFGLGRSFTTIRIQPHPRVEFSFNHSYFRDLPTFDPSLIQTGLLDKYLMQGFSAGTRVEVFKQVWLSADLGLSNHSGEKSNSLNQMFGITFGRVPWINMRTDLRYTRFSSSFGSGSYEGISLSKNLGETLQLQILAGQQNFASSLTSATHSRFVNANLETALGRNYFMQFGGTINRGDQMNYEQWIFTFGYRFDNRHGNRGQ